MDRTLPGKTRKGLLTAACNHEPDSQNTPVGPEVGTSMKIGGYSNVAGSRPADRTRPVQRNGSAGTTASARSDMRAVEVDDFFGIPAAEMTPKVREAIMGLMSEVENLRQELETANRRVADLEKLADEDPLAPVANRRAFVREMSRMISYTERYNVPSCLVFFDVNGLKRINDELGHKTGDQALIGVANTLVEHVRQTDVVGRIGGDEFGVILAQVNEETARVKAEELVKAIHDRPLVIDGQELHIEVAHGVFAFDGGSDATAALAEADRRMYRRKREMKEATAAGG